MKNINMKYKLVCLILAMYSASVWAQEKDIVEYGSFYQLKTGSSDKPEGWYISSNYYGVKEGDNWMRPGSTDNRSLRLQPDKKYIVQTNYQGKQNILMVQPGAEYQLSIWAKDTYEDTSGPNKMLFEIGWFAEDNANNVYQEVHAEEVGSIMQLSTDWKCYKHTVKVPAYANSASLKIKFLTYGSMILLDDVSMVKTKDAEVVEVHPPFGVQHRAFQHEVEVDWLPAEDKDVEWQAQVNGGDILSLGKQNSLALKRLKPGEKQNISIWGVKNGKQSAKVLVETSTKPFRYAQDDPMRIPYLSTIRDDGSCWRYLKTYFNELHNMDAAITYRQNGKLIEPDGNGVLLLHWEPSVSEYYDRTELEVTIDEGNGAKWTLTYQLTVSKDEE